MMIAKAQVPVIPVRIFGAFEALPRDKKLPQPVRITVSVGKPWQYRAADFPNAGKELYQQISDEVMRQISELQSS
jgi:1-acyl-sn-glycerol-3-phosphate acyltransferase